MDPMNPDRSLNASQRLVEGDINQSEARRQWWASQIDAETWEWLDRDAGCFLHQALSTPCLDVIQDAKGPYLENLQGKQYLDFHGNNVHQIGFSHPKLIARLTQQLQGLTFSTRRYTNEVAIQFAERLISTLPEGLDRVLMTPNGSSAVGIALKLARAITGKHKVLSFWDSFHGASMDVAGVSGEGIFTEYLGPLAGQAERIPPPITYRGIFEGNEDKALEQLEYVLTREHQIGAFLAETIRNTDVQIPSRHFWTQARELCDRHGVLLILDEIPIGLGRTGRLYAFEHYGIVPDILCLGKGLGGGLIPQAAIVTRTDFNRFQHISLGHYTHEKSPMGAAAGLAVLEIIEEEGLLAKTQEDEAFFRSSLKEFEDKFELIGDIRGIGLLWGIELVSDRRTKERATKEAEEIMYHCLSKGLSFKVSQGNVLQLSPALTIQREELQHALNILHESFLKTTIIG